MISLPFISLKIYQKRYTVNDSFSCEEKKRTDLLAGRSVLEKPGNAKVVAFPRLGGLHHRYEWEDAA